MKSITTTGSAIYGGAPTITPASPFIKWVGGKTQFLPELRKRLPEHIGTYVEPFVGGGALFFNTQPAKAILNDSNTKLTNLYVSVRDHVEELVDRLSEYETRYNTLSTLDEKQGFYYRNRTEFNSCDYESELTVEDAARFVFLNKTNCNGLFRENADGNYNAAFGWKKSIRLFDEANLVNCSAALKNFDIMNGDFEDACKGLSAGDFVYFDPPYYSTFNGYQAGGFSVEDHIRLHDLFLRLTEIGVYCMLSSSDTDFIRSLYSGHKIETVSAKRTINCNGNGRKGKELIITNYKTKC
jgi:DNA adenine methylase